MSSTLTMAPPPPVRKGHVQVFEATSKYKAQRDCELSFDEGDLIFVADRSDSKWWVAIIDRKKGYIPSDHVSSNNVKVAIVDAARRGNYDLLDECLAAGMSVNALDKSGCSALHGAAQGGHMQCLLRLLQEAKVELNLQNKIGDTPLHCAAVKGHNEVVKLLLQHGAIRHVANREKQTPRDLAKRGTIITLLDQGPGDESFEHQDCDVEGSEDSD